MYSLASSEIAALCPRAKTRPVVLEARVDLKPGDVIRVEHVGKGQTACLADNPITGPFSDANDIVGRVVAVDLPAGTVITGAYLVALGPAQLDARLRKFWRRCR